MFFSIREFLLITSLVFFFFKEANATLTTDCRIHQLNATTQTHLKFSTSSVLFSVGFLLLKPSIRNIKHAQIHIYPKNNKKYKHLQVLVNEESKVKIFVDDKKVATSEEPLPDMTSSPSWYYLKITINGEEFMVSRPESVLPIVKVVVPDVNENQFEVQVASTKHLYATTNCLSKCAFFESGVYKDLQINFPSNSNLSINLGIENTTWNKVAHSSSTKFAFGIGENEKNQTIKDITITKERNNILRSAWIKPQAFHPIIKGVNISIYFNDEMLFYRHIKSKSIFIRVYHSSNVFWAFGCQPEVTSERDGFRGRSLSFPSTIFPPPRASSKEKSNDSKFSMGEVAAWMVAALALCGLIILGITLYTRVSSTNNWTSDGMQQAPSMSRIVETEMIPMPKAKQSMFYTNLRKPEEGSIRESKNINVSLDNLYPLKFEAEDSKSQRGDPDGENYDSIRSCETTITDMSI